MSLFEIFLYLGIIAVLKFEAEVQNNLQSAQIQQKNKKIITKYS